MNIPARPNTSPVSRTSLSEAIVGIGLFAVLLWSACTASPNTGSDTDRGRPGGDPAFERITSRQLVVTGFDPRGEARDLTRQALFSVEPPGVARVSGDGVVTPSAGGDGVVLVEAGGLAAGFAPR